MAHQASLKRTIASIEKFGGRQKDCTAVVISVDAEAPLHS